MEMIKVSDQLVEVTKVMIKQFGDLNIRTVETVDGKLAVSAVDLAKTIDYNRQSLEKLIWRNRRLLKEHSFKVRISGILSGRSRPDLRVLTIQGVIFVALRLNASRVKNREKRRKIDNLQHWAMQTLDRLPPKL